MGLIKDIKDIQPLIDVSDLKGSLEEWDIVVTNMKPYIVIYDQNFLYQLRSFFDKDFMNFRGPFILIGAGGFLSARCYDDNLEKIENFYSSQSNKYKIIKIYRCNDKWTDKEKSSIKDMFNDAREILQDIIKTDKYELIWER